MASHLITKDIKRMVLNLADEFYFSSLIHRVLLVLLVPLVLSVQEVLVVLKVFEVTRESLVTKGPEVFLA